jgi:di/tricarboxylate transporter
VEPILALAPLWITLFCIYMLTSTLTELVTNNAVAIIMTPIVMNLAVALGQDPRLFAILVMIAASASFATPIGYQTNTLVYAAGGYRFLDFFRIGAPLNLIVGTVTVIILYLFYL